MPLPAAIEDQRRQAASAPFRSPLATLSRQLHSGSTLGDALPHTGRWLSDFDAALLRAGEQSGRLPGVLELLARHYRARADLARTLLVLLAYPLLLAHVAALIFPVERLQHLVLRGDWAGYVGHKLLLLVPFYTVVLLGIAAFQDSRGESWRALLERVLHYVPGLGPARRSLALARLAAALEALIGAGVSIIEAWDLAAAASGSPALRRIVQESKAKLYEGMTPADMVREHPAFPPTFASQYQVGEISGQLEASLIRLRDDCQEDGFRRLKVVFMVGAGLAVGLVLLLVAWQIIHFWVRYYQNIFEAIPGAT